MGKKKEETGGSWKHKFRLTIVNDNTFKEVWKIKMTKLEYFLLGSSSIIFLIVGVALLISFTNLKEFIPGYPDGRQRRDIIMNAFLLDSLQRELDSRDRYFENMRRIISGEVPQEAITEEQAGTTVVYEDLTFTKSMEDSLLRHQIEQEEQYSLTVEEEAPEEKNISDLHFFTPLKGMISSRFDIIEGHLGTDIVGGPGSIVHATLDGTIIFAGWTLETGYVVQIQHADDLISVYKHNSGLLKEAGSKVKAGESIAVIGESGELYTSGPHLHFELWLDGKAVDPEKYLVF